MANEITLTVSLAFAKGNITTITREFSRLQFDVTGDQFIHTVQLIGTSEEALDLGTLGASAGEPLGYMLVKNLDDTNFVDIRAAAGQQDVVRVRPGRVSVFELATNSPYAIADTAACQIEYYIIEA